MATGALKPKLPELQRRVLDGRSAWPPEAFYVVAAILAQAFAWHWPALIGSGGPVLLVPGWSIRFLVSRGFPGRPW